jgi:hypothetical protein
MVEAVHDDDATELLNNWTAVEDNEDVGEFFAQENALLCDTDRLMFHKGGNDNDDDDDDDDSSDEEEDATPATRNLPDNDHAAEIVVQQLTLLSQKIGSIDGEFSKAAQKVGEGCYIFKKIQRKMYLELQEPKKKKLKETSIATSSVNQPRQP